LLFSSPFKSLEGWRDKTPAPPCNGREAKVEAREVGGIMNAENPGKLEGSPIEEGLLGEVLGGSAS